MINTSYIIKNVKDVTVEILKASKQNFLANCRKSNDKSMCILKWEGETPKVFVGEKTFTHKEIKLELSKPEWITKDII